MIGIFQGRGIAETARVHAQIDVDLREHLHLFNNGRNSNALAVFLCIALHANEGGWAWPGRDLIHKETGIGTGHALSNALAHLRDMRIDGQRVFAHYRTRKPESRTWGRSAYLTFPDLPHPDAPFPGMEEWNPHEKWNPHAGDQQVGDHHAGDQHHEVEPSKVEPSKEEESGTDVPPLPADKNLDNWLKTTRIKGESTLEDMSPEDQAKVASPSAPDPPPDPTLPEWEQAMRGRLKGSTLPGDFTPGDVIGYCQRFYDRTSNPPPATRKGNDNWRSGAVATLESFHGSLFTLYESRGHPMPDIDTRRRLFGLAVDVFFATGAGYDHIRAATPRSLANSMAGLIGDLVDISNFYGLGGTSVLPNQGHIKNWIAQGEDAEHGKKKGKRSGRSKAVDAGVRGPGQTQGASDGDRALAARLIAARTGAGA